MDARAEEQLMEELTFDAYGRHALIRDIINANRREGESFRVLDVGGRGNFTRRFLPDDEVFFLDPHVDEKGENHIEGDGCDMPLEDGSFDFVVSVDVFEHVPPARREDFLKENLRVARLAAVLAAPFSSPAVEKAERVANDNHRIIAGGEDHIWLKEHIANGLPDAGEVEGFASRNGYAFQRLANNSLGLWEELALASFLPAAGVEDRLRRFNRFYNEKVFPHDHDGESYRKIYFIMKEKGLREFVLEGGGMDEALRLEVTRENMRLLSHLFAHQRQRLRQLEAADHEHREQLERTRRQLDEASAQLERIRSSFAWKVTGPLRRIWPRANRHGRVR